MIESKETLTGDIISKQTIKGDLNTTEVKVLPELENLTIIPQTVQQVFTHENSYGYDKVTVEAIPEIKINLQTKEATPTKEVQTITSDEGYDGLNEVTVNPIPDNYIEPSGTLDITENGTYDVKQYAEVTVNVAGGEQSSTLPDGYTELLCIKSSKTQYIKTGVIPNEMTGFEIDFVSHDSLSLYSPNFGALFGARDNWYTNAYGLTTYSDTGYSNGHMLYGSVDHYNYVNQIRNNAGIVPETRQTISLKNKVFTKGDGTQTTLNPQVGITSDIEITIFGINDKSENKIIEYSNTDLYRLKFYVGDALIRDYIPAMRVSDNVVGLYDLVNGTFNVNSGTGAFGAEAKPNEPSESATKEMYCGDVTSTNATSFQGIGAFWFSNYIQDMVGSKLKSVTLNGTTTGGTITFVGNDTITVNKHLTNLQTLNDLAVTLNNDKDTKEIFKITVDSGIQTYMLDGSDSRVTILNQEFIDSCPLSVGVSKPGDTSDFYYNLSNLPNNNEIIFFHNGINVGNITESQQSGLGMHFVYKKAE